MNRRQHVRRVLLAAGWRPVWTSEAAITVWKKPPAPWCYPEELADRMERGEGLGTVLDFSTRGER